jgi:hypothetical protein
MSLTTYSRKMLPSLHHDLHPAATYKPSYHQHFTHRYPQRGRRVFPDAPTGRAIRCDTRGPTSGICELVRRVSGADSSSLSGYKSGDGSYSVAEVPDVVLHDAKRNKDLHVRVFY